MVCIYSGTRAGVLTLFRPVYSNSSLIKPRSGCGGLRSVQNSGLIANQIFQNFVEYQGQNEIFLNRVLSMLYLMCLCFLICDLSLRILIIANFLQLDCNFCKGIVIA